MPKGPGRPNQGKTKTIRKRAVNVYLPTEELLKEWKKSAKEAGISLSQFILEAVERERAHSLGPRLPKLELEKAFKETQEELSKLQSKYEILKAAFEKRDQDAKELSELLEHKKEAPWDMELAKEMIDIFKNWPEPEIGSDVLFEVLGIQLSEKHRLRQVREVGDLLESLGLVKTVFGFWEWQGDWTGKSPYTSKRTGIIYGRKIEVPR